MSVGLPSEALPSDGWSVIRFCPSVCPAVAPSFCEAVLPVCPGRFCRAVLPAPSERSEAMALCCRLAEVLVCRGLSFAERGFAERWLVGQVLSVAVCPAVAPSFCEGACCRFVLSVLSLSFVPGCRASMRLSILTNSEISREIA